jgi:hypothetical protein
MIVEFLSQTEIIEECYEFMLAYAAQGLPGDAGSQKGTQIRDFLDRAVKAADGLSRSYASAVEGADLKPAEKYRAFLAVLGRDAQDSIAAMELVLAQPSISSQLVDNLNASIHLRALLTDLFLIGEILRKHSS